MVMEQQNQEGEGLGWLAFVHETHVGVQQLQNKMETLAMDLKVMKEHFEKMQK